MRLRLRWCVLLGTFLSGCYSSHLPTPILDAGRREDLPAEREVLARREARPDFAHIQTTLSTLGVPVNSTLGNWRNIGPRNHAGKVFDLAVDPTNPNIVVAAFGAQGGLWKTTDGGSSWAQINDRTRDHSFASVAIAPSNPNTIIVGLSAIDLPDADSGLLRSSDGGTTWTSIGPSVSGFHGFYRIVIDPSNASIIYAASETALYKTTDGGASWTTLLTYSGQVTIYGFEVAPDLVMSSGDSRVLLFAQKNLGVYRTADSGATWNSVDPDPSHPGETVLAWAPSTNTVYCERFFAGEWTQLHTYVSTNGGVSWTPRAVLAESHQGRYDMALAVDPVNSNHVLYGNQAFGSSTDGLQTYTSWYGDKLHPDHLRFVFAPSNPAIVYGGNDGGVWRSADSGQTWTRADVGIPSTISFGFDVDRVTGEILMSPGDYGCTRYDGDTSNWADFHGGEWTDFFISPFDRNVIFSGLGTTQRSTDGGGSWVTADPEAALGRTAERPYRYPFVFHPTDPNTVYTSSKRVFRSTNLGSSWTMISPAAFDAKTYGYVDGLDVARTNPSVIYAIGWGELWSTTNGGASWSLNPNASGQTVVVADPTDASSAYLGGYQGVMYCTQYGASCFNISSNLGNVRVRDIVVGTQNVYLGTDQGVFVKTPGVSDWQRLGNLPPIRVWKLLLTGGRLFASTGQSVWQNDLAGTGGPSIGGFAVSPPSTIPWSAATIQWNATNGNSSISSIGGVPGFGTLIAHPASTTSYALTVSDGVSQTSSSSRTVTIDTSQTVGMLPRDFATGTWAYEEYYPATGSVVALPNAGTTTQNAGSFASSGPTYMSSTVYGYIMLDQRNVIMIHPPAATDRRVAASFRVTNSGTYRVTGAFTRLNDYIDNGDGAVASIVRNTEATPLFSTQVPVSIASSISNPWGAKERAPRWFDFTVTLNAGDKLRFMVGSGPAGQDWFDETGLVAAITTASPPSPPANLVAYYSPAQVSPVVVNVSWSAVANAASYEVERRSAGSGYAKIATVQGTTYADNAVVQGQAYVYRVRAVSGGLASGYSNQDHATVYAFSDAAPVSGSIVLARQFTELRQAVNMVRAAAGLPAASWTDAQLQGVAIKALHVQELQTAMGAALVSIGKSASFTTAPVSGSPVRAVDFNDLRSSIE